MKICFKEELPADKSADLRVERQAQSANMALIPSVRNHGGGDCDSMHMRMLKQIRHTRRCRLLQLKGKYMSPYSLTHLTHDVIGRILHDSIQDVTQE